MTKHNFKRTDTRPKVEFRPTEDNQRVTLPAGVSATFRMVAREGKAQCRLCDHTVEGDDFGEIFDKLFEHGEEVHEWTDGEGWTDR